MKIGPFEITTAKTFGKLREDIQLLQRQVEDIGWTRIGTDQNDIRSLLGLSMWDIIARSRRGWITNPLTGHAVNLTTWFTFGQGISEPTAADERVQAVISDFWNDEDNKRWLTSPTAQEQLSNKLQTDGQVFFLLFVNRMTAQTKVTVAEPLSIQDIIRNDQTLRNLFYKQMIFQGEYNYTTGNYVPSFNGNNFRFVPDIGIADPDAAADIPLDKRAWDDATDVFIYHLKVNCDIRDKWGMPETFRSQDWTNAHKDMSEDMATLIRSLATWAWKKKVNGTQGQINTLKSNLQMVQNQSVPRSVTGGVQIENANVDLQPIPTPTGGANIHETGLRLLLRMSAIGYSIFEHYFGDTGTANLATATAMELPMLKKFQARQTMWEGAYDKILSFVIGRAVIVGTLPGEAYINERENRWVIESPLDLGTDIDFPPILDSDLVKLKDAYAGAAEAKLISKEGAARQFMLGAGINNIEDELIQIKKESAEDDAKAPPVDGDDPLADDPIPVPTKESSAKAAEDRLMRKIALLKRGQGAYDRVLVSILSRFSESIAKRAKTLGPAGSVGVSFTDLSGELEVLAEDMQKAARKFFPEAVRMGAKFVYAHLKPDQKAKMTESSHQSFLEDRLTWNARAVSGSLIPSIRAKIEQVTAAEFASPEAARAAIKDSVGSFAGRVSQYAGAYWTVEEKAVKEFGTQFDMMVNFIGPDDDATCEECAAYVNGGPYPIAEAPVPGEDTVCRGNCRHALQITSQEMVGVA